MAVVAASNIQARTVMSDAISDEQVAEITFNVSGTYAAENFEITDATDAIESSRRNGKTVTLLGAMMGHSATKTGTNTIMALKSVAVSGDKVTADITDGDYTTELSAGAVPAQDRPFSVFVSFKEA